MQATLSDGYGITGRRPIQLQGQTQQAHIVAVDYTANKITIDTSLTWTSGQGVGLAYSGTAPDIGAFEYASAYAIREKAQPPVCYHFYQKAGGIVFSGLPGKPGDKIEVRIYSVSGKQMLLYANSFQSRICVTEAGLSQGLYIYSVTLNGRHAVSGKIAVY